MSLERPAISIVSVTFSCPKHGTSEQLRTYNGRKLLSHGGDVFPCRCWYELEDEWFGQWDRAGQELGTPEPGGQRELFSALSVYPQGGAG